MSDQPARGQFGIGEVLGQLRPEFPDISASKIRFLEDKGLIEPARSRSGYRRFSGADIQRLRYILTVQRDTYLPLQVIRERLADGAADGAAAPSGPGSLGGLAAVGRDGTGRVPADMSRRQLLEAAGIDDEELIELEDYGLIRRVGQAVRAGCPGRRPRRGRAAPVRGAGPAPASGQGRSRPGSQPGRAGGGAPAAPARPRGQGRGRPDGLADRGSHPAAARDAGRIGAG